MAENNVTTQPPRWLDERPISAANEDLLGYDDSAQRLAQRLVAARGSGQRMRSLTVSLEGPWGSGKSSFSNLLISHLDGRDEDKDESDTTAPRVVVFNAWQSGSRSLSAWGALAYRIGQSFYSRFHNRCLECPRDEEVAIGHPLNSGEVLRIDPDNADLRDSRLHWIEVAHRLSMAIPKKEWAPCLNLFCDAPSKIPGRHLSWQEGGSQALMSTGKALLSMASGGVGSAIENAGQGAGALCDKRLAEGPSWGTDTLEFVEQLNELLAVLHHDASSWKSIVFVDDVTRLMETNELQHVLEALGYLRELDDVLVLINLDDRLVRRLHNLNSRLHNLNKGGVGKVDDPDRESSRHPQSPSEPFLARLVSLRFQIPKPRPGESGRMMGTLFRDLGLPHHLAAKASRYLKEYGVRTPRQVKRALLWLWFRLHRPEEEKGSFDDSNLQLLLSLYLFLQEDLEGPEVARQAAGNKHQLLSFEVQPWDLRPWIDKSLLQVFENDQHGLKDVARDLVARVRLLSLVAYCSEKDLEEYRKDTEWKAWGERLVEVGGPLGDAIAALDIHRLNAAWSDFVRNDMPAATLSSLVEFTSTARYFHLAPGHVDENSAASLRRWFDLDTLFKVAHNEQSDTLAKFAQHLYNLVTLTVSPHDPA